MVTQIAKYLRGLPVEPDIRLSSLAHELAEVSS